MFKNKRLRPEAQNLVLLNIFLGVFALAMLAYAGFILIELHGQGLHPVQISKEMSLIVMSYASVLIYGAQKAVQNIGNRFGYKIGVDRSAQDPVHNSLTLPILPSVVLVMLSIIALGANLTPLFVAGVFSAIASAYVVNKAVKFYLVGKFEPAYLKELAAHDMQENETHLIKLRTQIMDAIDELKNVYHSAIDSGFEANLNEIRNQVAQQRFSLAELKEILSNLQNVRRGVDARRALSKLKHKGKA